jgi:hypothetical protein
MMSFFLSAHNDKTAFTSVGAGSPRTSKTESFNGQPTDDIKPALAAPFTNIRIGFAARAGYKSISKHSTLILQGQSVNEPAPTKECYGVCV